MGKRKTKAQDPKPDEKPKRLAPMDQVNYIRTIAAMEACKVMAQVAVTIPGDAWTNVGSDADPTGRLLCPLIVGTALESRCVMHLEAVAIMHDGPFQVGATPPLDRELDVMRSAFAIPFKMESVTINGREYVLFAHPHCK